VIGGGCSWLAVGARGSWMVKRRARNGEGLSSPFVDSGGGWVWMAVGARRRSWMVEVGARRHSWMVEVGAGVR